MESMGSRSSHSSLRKGGREVDRNRWKTARFGGDIETLEMDFAFDGFVNFRPGGYVERLANRAKCKCRLSSIGCCEKCFVMSRNRTLGGMLTQLSWLLS